MTWDDRDPFKHLKKDKADAYKRAHKGYISLGRDHHSPATSGLHTKSTTINKFLPDIVRNKRDQVESHFTLGSHKPEYMTTNRASSIIDGEESEDELSRLDEVSSMQGSVWDPDVLRPHRANDMLTYNKASHWRLGSDRSNYSTTNKSLFKSPKMLKLKQSTLTTNADTFDNRRSYLSFGVSPKARNSPHIEKAPFNMTG